jgi:hypothetical protein
VYLTDDERWRAMPRGDDDRVVHDCYECSIKHRRSPYVWVPLAGVIVAVFPLLWMLWSHLVAPVLILLAFLWYLARWLQGRWAWLQRLRRGEGSDDARERALADSDQRTSMRT